MRRDQTQEPASQNPCRAPESVESKACAQHNSGYHNQAGRWPQGSSPSCEKTQNASSCTPRPRKAQTTQTSCSYHTQLHHIAPLHHLGELDLVTVTGSMSSDTRSARCCSESAMAALVKTILTAVFGRGAWGSTCIRRKFPEAQFHLSFHHLYMGVSFHPGCTFAFIFSTLPQMMSPKELGSAETISFRLVD